MPKSKKSGNNLMEYMMKVLKFLGIPSIKRKGKTVIGFELTDLIKSICFSNKEDMVDIKMDNGLSFKIPAVVYPDALYKFFVKSAGTTLGFDIVLEKVLR